MEKTDFTELENFIKGKRVAIVGNSTSIFDMKYGDDIDKHDIVIRFNKGFPVKPESQGKRTDILMLACKLDKERIKRYHPKYTVRRLNVSAYNFRCDFVFTNPYIRRISKGLGARASTGLMAVEWCLANDVKSIDLYGFDFFKNPTYYNPIGYKTQHSGDGERERILGYQDEGRLKVWSKIDFEKKDSIIKPCNEKMEIVYVFDKNYIPYFEMSVKSVLKYNPNAHITVVSPEKLNIKYDNIVIPVEKNLKHRVNDRITDATYLKLKLADLPYKKILYIDADVLCFKPLDELWNSNCKYITLTESHTYGKKQACEHGHARYGLSGVMLMNLEEMRKDNFKEKAFKPFDSSKITLWCHEETIINHYFYDKLTFADVKYNYCYNRQYDHPLKNDEIALLHFPSKEKKAMKLIFETNFK